MSYLTVIRCDEFLLKDVLTGANYTTVFFNSRKKNASLFWELFLGSWKRKAVKCDPLMVRGKGKGKDL